MSETPDLWCWCCHAPAASDAQGNYCQRCRDEHCAGSHLRRDVHEYKMDMDMAGQMQAHLRDELAKAQAERDEARRLVTMLLEYGTEGLDYDTLPGWARGKQW